MRTIIAHISFLLVVLALGCFWIVRVISTFKTKEANKMFKEGCKGAAEIFIL